MSYRERIAYKLSTALVRECVRSLRGVTGDDWRDAPADWKFTDDEAHRTRPYPMGFYANDPRLYWAMGWGMSVEMWPWERWLVMRVFGAAKERSR
jgi:hypothetical protein